MTAPSGATTAELALPCVATSARRYGMLADTSELIATPLRVNVGKTSALAFLASSPARGALVAILAVCCVVVGALLVNVSELNIRGLGNTLNDQVGYVSVARHLVETGELRSSLIYPSLLSQNADKNYLYMPGHYLALAASYLLFGFGATQSIIPSMVAYVIASVSVFFAVSKMYGRKFALATALLFVFFPPNIVYALTAMAEMTLLASVCLTFAIFVHLPFRWKVGLGPFLLILPLLFRETGVVIAIPFALLILFGEGRRRPKAALLFVLLSTLVTVFVLKADFSDDRPSLATLEIFSLDEQAIYADAFALERLNPAAEDWLLAPAVKFAHNAQVLKSVLSTTVGSFFRAGVQPQTGVASLEIFSLGLMASSVPLGIVALFVKRRDPLLFGGFAVLSVLFVAILSLYFVRYFQAVRVLLIAVPFVCIIWVVLLQHLHRTLAYYPVGRFRSGLVWGFFGMAAVFSLSLTYAALGPNQIERSNAARDAAFMESVQHDNAYVLVAPWDLAFEYVYAHDQVTWAFLPANRETLRLLNSTHPIGTIILPAVSTESMLTAADITDEGFTVDRTVILEDRQYTVYKRER